MGPSASLWAIRMCLWPKLDNGNNTLALLELPLSNIINIKFMCSLPDSCNYDLVQNIYSDFELCKSYHSHLALVQDLMGPSSTSHHQDKGRKICYDPRDLTS